MSLYLLIIIIDSVSADMVTTWWFTKCGVGLSVVFLLILTLLKLKCWLRCVYLAFNLPGPHPAILWGNRKLHSSEAVMVFKSLHKLYGPLAKVWITFIPFIIISDPNYIKPVLGSARQIDKNLIYGFLSRFFGMGLLTSSGAKWKHDRKLIQPFFHPTILRSFIGAFIQSSELVIKELESREDEVKITTLINDCALNVLHRSVLGIPIDDYETKSRSPFTNGHIFTLSRIVRPLYTFDFFYQFSSMFNTEAKQQLTFKEFAKEILDKRRQSNSKLNWSLLDYLINVSETNPEFGDEDIVDHICTFMLSGQDTVAGAISFTLYNLATHPEVQRKVVDELEQIFEKHPKVDMDSLNQMVYLEQCINESLRLFPSIPLISKKLVEDVQLDNYTLPAGLNIFILPIGVHRLEEYYPDPEAFDPERFSSVNKKTLHPYSFLPFSAGPRNCIGYKFAYLEMKTVISTILRHYIIRVPADHKLKLSYRVILRARGIVLRLKPRH